MLLAVRQTSYSSASIQTTWDRLQQKGSLSFAASLSLRTCQVPRASGNWSCNDVPSSAVLHPQGACTRLCSHHKVCSAGLLAHTAEALGEGVVRHLAGAWDLSWPTSSLSTTGYLQIVRHACERFQLP